MSNTAIVKFPEPNQVANPALTKNRDVASDSQRSDISRWWQFIRRRFWIICAFGIFAALLGLVKAAHQVPVYQSSLTMLIEPKWGNAGTVEQYLFSYANPYFFYKTQYQIIRSRAVAERVAEKLDAAPAPRRRVEASTPMTPIYTGIRKWFGGERLLPATVSNDFESAVNRISDGIRVRGGEQSQIVVINYKSTDPVYAALVTNAAASAYTELSLDTRLSSARVTSSWLTDQISELRQKVIDAELRLQEYQAKESLVDSERGNQLATGRLSQLNERYLAAQSEVTSLAKRYGERHPTLIAAQAEADALAVRLRNERGSVVASQGKAFELAKLERDVTTYRELYDQFLTRFKEADIAARNDINDVRIIDAARAAPLPIGPKRERTIFLFVLFGVIIGTVLCWLRERLDNTLKTPDDVESKIKLPVLGMVPLVKSGRRSSAIPERCYLHDQRSGFTEMINHIRTNVLFSDVDNPPKTTLISSSVQGEGKTTLAINLALSFSQLGRTVLIDADLRRPRIADVFSDVVSRESLTPQNGDDGATCGGLVGAVAGRCELDDALVKDPRSNNLWLLPTGVIPPNPLELISSHRFSALMGELDQQFDFIVVDSAPIVPVSDAMVLSSYADVLLLVVRSDNTSQNVVRNAVSRLSSFQSDNQGVVLTQVNQRHLTSYYHEDHYGYYGDYASHAKATA